MGKCWITTCTALAFFFCEWAFWIALICIYFVKQRFSININIKLYFDAHSYFLMLFLQTMQNVSLAQIDTIFHHFFLLREFLCTFNCILKCKLFYLFFNKKSFSSTYFLKFFPLHSNLVEALVLPFHMGLWKDYF